MSNTMYTLHEAQTEFLACSQSNYSYKNITTHVK